MKTAAAYIRVSTEDQIEYSPDSQIKVIRDYAKRNELIIPEEYIFIDEGISGRKAEKRPAFMKMIATAKSKPTPFECIVVWKFSRFARNREDSIVYKSMLKKQCGIDVISVSEQLSQDKTSILIEALLEAMDEYYSINLGEEVKRGMTEKASRGEPLSVPAFGYLLKDKRLIVDDREAEIVQKIFSDFISGKSQREIAIEINSFGVRSHRGNTFETRTIEYILNNPVYIGKIRWNPAHRTRRNYTDENLMIVDGHHTPIISQDVWNKAQKILSKNKAMHKKSEKPFAFSNELQGLLRCSSCNGTLIKNGRYMQCQRYTKAKCTQSHNIVYDIAVETVVSGIENDFRTGNLKIERRSNSANVDLSSINAKIGREKTKLERVKQAYENGIDTIDEYKINKERIQNTIDALNQKITTASSKITVKDLTKAFLKKYSGVVKQLRDNNISIEAKNKSMRMFVDKVVYDKASNAFDFYYFF